MVPHRVPFLLFCATLALLLTEGNSAEGNSAEGESFSFRGAAFQQNDLEMDLEEAYDDDGDGDGGGSKKNAADGIETGSSKAKKSGGDDDGGDGDGSDDGGDDDKAAKPNSKASAPAAKKPASDDGDGDGDGGSGDDDEGDDDTEKHKKAMKKYLKNPKSAKLKKAAMGMKITKPFHIQDRTQGGEKPAELKTPHEFCTAGQFFSTTDTACVDCPEGKFMKRKGGLKCNICPSAYYQLLNGQNYCSPNPCKAGFHMTWMHCQPCPVNTISQAGSQLCTKCPKGTDTKWRRGQSQCTTTITPAPTPPTAAPTSPPTIPPLHTPHVCLNMKCVYDPATHMTREVRIQGGFEYPGKLIHKCHYDNYSGNCLCICMQDSEGRRKFFEEHPRLMHREEQELRDEKSGKYKRHKKKRRQEMKPHMQDYYPRRK